MNDIPDEHLDIILSLQLAVAWAGESESDPPRLGWWRTALFDEYGGEDLFKRLTPLTYRWAVFQCLLEAAQRTDEAARKKSAEPDRVVSLFRFGFGLDELLADRLQELKRSHPEPLVALPELGALVTEAWASERLEAWLQAKADVKFEKVPFGRRIKAPLPKSPKDAALQLASALVPFHQDYPFVHFLEKP